MSFQLNDFDWQKFDWQPYGKALCKDGAFKYRILPFVVLVVGLIASYFIGQEISNLLGLRRGASIAPVYAGFALSLAVFIFILRRNSKILAAALFASKYRAGPVEITIDAEGLKYSARYNSSITRWPCFTEVLGYKDGLILRLSQNEGMPIPDQFLPTGMTRETAKAQILSYMAEAKDD